MALFQVLGWDETSENKHASNLWKYTLRILEIKVETCQEPATVNVPLNILLVLQIILDTIHALHSLGPTCEGEK